MKSPANLDDPVKTYCEVLIYQSYAEPLILNTYVVPNTSTAKNAIEEEWKSRGAIYIKKSPPNESFWINSNFKLSTDCLSDINHDEISLTYNLSPAYFEVCIDKPGDVFKMELKVPEGRLIWKASIRKGADYKTAMPTCSADQGGAVSLPTALTGEDPEKAASGFSAEDKNAKLMKSSLKRGEDPEEAASGFSPEAKYAKIVAQGGSHVSAPTVQRDININSNIHHHYHVMETRPEVKDVVDNTNEDKVGTLEGAGPRSSSASPVKARDKVKKNRKELIQRIGDATLKSVLDGLQEDSPNHPVITLRERNEVLQKHHVTEDRVTCLVDMLLNKGERPCETFLSLLRELEPNLCDELGL